MAICLDVGLRRIILGVWCLVLQFVSSLKLLACALVLFPFILIPLLLPIIGCIPFIGKTRMFVMPIYFLFRVWVSQLKDRFHYVGWVCLTCAVLSSIAASVMVSSETQLIDTNHSAQCIFLSFPYFLSYLLFLFSFRSAREIVISMEEEGIQK